MTTKQETCHKNTDDITDLDLAETISVLKSLDKEGKLDDFKEAVIHVMASYYAKKRIAKATGDMSGLEAAFEEQTKQLQSMKLPDGILKEVFGLLN